MPTGTIEKRVNQRCYVRRRFQQVPSNPGVGSGCWNSGEEQWKCGGRLGNQASWGLDELQDARVFGYFVQQSNRFIWDVNFGIASFNAQFEYTAQQIAFDEASVDPDGFQYIRQTTCE